LLNRIEESILFYTSRRWTKNPTFSLWTTLHGRLTPRSFHLLIVSSSYIKYFFDFTLFVVCFIQAALLAKCWIAAVSSCTTDDLGLRPSDQARYRGKQVLAPVHFTRASIGGVNADDGARCRRLSCMETFCSCGAKCSVSFRLSIRCSSMCVNLCRAVWDHFKLGQRADKIKKHITLNLVNEPIR